MKKIYFLLFCLLFLNQIKAQNPSDRDRTFNEFNLPINNYFVEAEVLKSTVLPDGKILILNNKYELIKLDGNLKDNSFNIGTGFEFSNPSFLSVEDFTVQNDGKILVTGSFSKFNGVNVSRIIRLNPNGTLDTNFLAPFYNVGSGIFSLKVQSDGKILIVIGLINDVSTKNLKRLNANGSLDTTFNTDDNYRFRCFALQADGKIIVSHSLAQGLPESYDSDGKYISRLNTDGSFDSSFTTANFSTDVIYPINEIKIQNDQKIVVAGRFFTCNNLPNNNIVRLDTNGTVDTSFNTGTGFSLSSQVTGKSSTNQILIQQDQKIIIGGFFEKYNNIDRYNLVRLNTDGTIDNSFGDVISFLGLESVSSLSFFNDEKILASGYLANKKVDGYIVKINSNGTKDNSFNNICKGFFNNLVNTVVETADGKLLVGGSFQSYNGKSVVALARLNNDGSLDNSLNFVDQNSFAVTSITAIKPISNGQILLGGQMYNSSVEKGIIKINSDGSLDNSFNYDVNFTTSPSEIILLEDGKLLINAKGLDSGETYYPVLLEANGTRALTYFNFDSKCIIKELPDGKILIGGKKNNVIYLNRRLNSNINLIDTTFELDTTIINNGVNTVCIQQDGRILLEGDFIVNGVQSKLIRIFNNGGLDNSFNCNLINNNYEINNISILPNQKILISYTDLYATFLTKINRLNIDGTLDSSFNEQIMEFYLADYSGSSGTHKSNVFTYSLSSGKILVYSLKAYQGQEARGLIRLMGEDYNFLKGDFKIDLNNNGCDTNDQFLKGIKLNISTGSNSFNYVTDTTGYFSIGLSNTSIITPILEAPTYFNVLPTSTTVTFSNQANTFTQNFCVTTNGIHNDLEVTILPLNVARPGVVAKYKIIYKNKGTITQSGSVNLTFDDAVLDFVFANPITTSQTINNLSWNFTNLVPLETREIIATLKVNSPTQTPAVNVGDILSFTANVIAATDETPNDNVLTLNQTVVNSFDPNDKTCLEGATIATTKVGDYVHYMIRFENNGTANAQNIVVKDIIDTTKLDITTLFPVKSSHNFTTRIDGEKIEFIFENINLPFTTGTNDGYVVFKIKTKSSLALGNSFSNSANIYFDYNFPIVTNTATTTISAALSLQDFDFSNYFDVYPNPVESVLNITSKENIEVSSINIYNTLGQLVLVTPNAQNTKSVDVSSLTSGNYFIKINSDKGTSNIKFIKK